MISARSALVIPKLRTPLVVSSIRYNSTTPSTKKSSLLGKRPKDAIGQTPSVTKIGIPNKVYVPMRLSKMPSLFTHPVQFIKCVARRMALVGINTLQIIDFRRSMKPNFLLWKNEAIEKYVLVNKLFAKQNLQPAKNACSVYVYNALEKRLNSLPKNIEMDWKLLKFNKVPKIISFNNFPNEDGSTLCLQITYKFNTKQRLVTVSNGDVKTQDRDMIEYLSFNVDPYSNQVCLAGSSFESEPDEIVYSRDRSYSQKQIADNMVIYGDIYRSEPLKLIK